MNVEMPDGYIVRDVPDNATRDQVRKLYASQKRGEMTTKLNVPDERQIANMESFVQTIPEPQRNLIAMGRAASRPIEFGMSIAGNTGMISPDEYRAYQDSRDADMQNYSYLKQATPGASFSEFLGEMGMSAPAMRLPTLRNPVADIGLQTLAGVGIGGATSGDIGGAGVGGGAGLLSQSTYRGALGASNLPRRILGRIMDKADATPYASEGRQLAKETGIPLTPYQETGSKALGYLEAAARQSMLTADRVSGVDQAQGQRTIARIKSVADSLSKHVRGKATIGEDIQTSLNNAVGDMARIRDANADRNYGVVRQMAQGRPVVSYDNLRAELEAIINQYDGVPAAEARAIVSGARQKLADIQGVVSPARDVKTPMVYYREAEKRGPLPGTVDEAMRARKFYGEAARSGGNVFDNVAPSTNRKIAARLFRAISSDFDAAGGAQSPIGEAFKKANDDYRAYSESIDYVKKSVLGKLLGEDVADSAITGIETNTVAGERVLERVLRAHPSEIKTILPLIKQANPQVVQDLKAYLIRDALEKSVTLSVKDSQVLGPISYAKFEKNVPDVDRLKALGWSAKELQDLQSTIRAMSRAGDRFGMNYSNTNVRGETMQAVEAAGAAMTGRIGAAAKAGISIFGRYVGMKQVADAMADPAKRQALRALSEPNITAARASRLLSFIGAEAMQGN